MQNRNFQNILTILLGFYCLACCILVFYKNYAFTPSIAIPMILISTILAIIEWIRTKSTDRTPPTKMMISLMIIWNIYLLFQIM